MGQLRSLFLTLILFTGVSIAGFSQDRGGPPAPDMMQSNREGPPCDDFDDDGIGDDDGVPPPPGLCLPIDDYVYILMAVGVMYGCYKLRDFDTAKTAP